ncbi:hypothetical protein D9M68_274070 [compost metagenome]
MADESADCESLAVDRQAGDIAQAVRIGDREDAVDRSAAIAGTRSAGEASFVDLPVAHEDAAGIAAAAIGDDRRVVIWIKRKGKKLGRLEGRKFQGGRRQQTDDRSGLANVRVGVTKTAAAALVRDDADAAVRTRCNVDAVFAEHGHQGFARDFSIADDEGRNLQCGVVNGDRRAVRLFQNDIGTDDLDILDRRTCGQVHHVRSIGGDRRGHGLRLWRCLGAFHRRSGCRVDEVGFSLFSRRRLRHQSVSLAIRRVAELDCLCLRSGGFVRNCGAFGCHRNTPRPLRARKHQAFWSAIGG